MKIYEGLDAFPRLNYAVVTSGTFDGVHLGHQKIIARLKETAARHKGETVLLTYWPHPRFVLNPDNKDLQLLSTFEEKAALLETYGIDHLVKIPFTKEFSKLSSEEFIRQILIDKIHTQKLVIGYDHRFGRNREGGFEHLKANAAQYGFEVEEIPRQDIDEVGISSTKIRKALTKGEIQNANRLLNHPYSIEGEVVNGEQLGRKMGFPTANIAIREKYKLIPADGVYAVKVDRNGQQLNGMLNIGNRPTFNGQSKTIEVHIFDFDQQIYGEKLRISFVGQIRKEKKFSDLEELKKQLKKDEEIARNMLNF